jgi:Fe-S cluster assembly ATP-binding protein
LFLRRQVGAGLSGGEKKQAEILQMLVLSPRFAFLDEIDSGVDVDALKLVVAGIDRIKAKGTGFILVTHYDTLLSAISPDYVYVMRDGRIVASGGRELSERIKTKGFANI